MVAAIVPMLGFRLLYRYYGFRYSADIRVAAIVPILWLTL